MRSIAATTQDDILMASVLDYEAEVVFFGELQSLDDMFWFGDIDGVLHVWPLTTWDGWVCEGITSFIQEDRIHDGGWMEFTTFPLNQKGRGQCT